MKDAVTVATKESWYKNKKVLTSFLGIFLISVMVLSALGLNPDAEEKVVYKDMKFYHADTGKWQTFLADGKQVVVSTDPSAFAAMDVPSLDFSSLSSLQKLYISMNPQDSVQNAVYDIDFNLPLPPQTDLACYEDNDQCSTFPLKTCADATMTTGVILLRESNETSVSFEGNCWTIEGKDLLTLTDKLILDYYG